MKDEEFSQGIKVKVRLTGNGSATLFVPGLDEHYHSHHGARQELAYVCIRHGLAPLLPGFRLQKLPRALEHATLKPNRYDLIYFDAFAPDK